MVALHSGQNGAVLNWLSHRVDFTLSPDSQLFWATSDLDGSIVGAVGAGGRMGRTWGSISIALVNPQVSVPLMRMGFCWFFGTMNAAAGYVTIGSRRKKWIQSLCRTVGFYQADRVKMGISPREDLVVLKVTADSCRPWQAELRKLSRAHAREVG